MSDAVRAARALRSGEQRATLAEFIAGGALDADLAALVWLLAESGVPLVVASADAAAARRLRGAISALVPHDRRASDVALAGGTVLADSLEEVLRVMGSAGTSELTDAARDLGVVIIVRDGRVHAAHYVRPLERDAAGHVQRRPPALLSAWNTESDALDHFHWAISDELATRAAMSAAAFEKEYRARVRRLGAAQVGSSGD